MPSIETSRLNLRPFRPEDVALMHHLLQADGILRYFPKTDPMTGERVQLMIDRILAHWQERGFGLWAVELRQTGEMMGRTGLQRIPDTGETEIDFLLGEPYWSRGYATEAGLVVLRHGFDVLGEESIVGIVHPDNAASRRVLEKIGMTVTREAVYFGMECLRYAIDRESWRRMSPGG